jgi:hypothetical protein
MSVEANMGTGQRFKGEILLGHKGAAVEVPFDPAERWGLAAEPLWRGRRGHVVRGRLNGKPFTSSVVPRMKRFWVLVDAEVLRAAKVSVGDTVEVALEPVETPVKVKAPKRTIATRASGARRLRGTNGLRAASDSRDSRAKR